MFVGGHDRFEEKGGLEWKIGTNFFARNKVLNVFYLKILLKEKKTIFSKINGKYYERNFLYDYNWKWFIKIFPIFEEKQEFLSALKKIFGKIEKNVKNVTGNAQRIRQNVPKFEDNCGKSFSINMGNFITILTRFNKNFEKS